jgi:hypothetical protein
MNSIKDNNINCENNVNENNKSLKVKEYLRNYYQKNKAAMNAKITCDLCKIEYNKKHKSDHMKTQKHRLLVLEKHVADIKSLSTSS